MENKNLNNNPNLNQELQKQFGFEPVVIFLAVDGKKDFIVVNGDAKLTDEPITDEDIEFVEIKDINEIRSMAWSSNCKWTFIIQPDCIYLINTYEDLAVKCRKKSQQFIEMYLDANRQQI